MALLLRDFWFDAALLPHPEGAALDYPALCDVASDMAAVLATPDSVGAAGSGGVTSGRPVNNTGGHPDLALAPLTLHVWSTIAQRRLALTPAQALVYFETFALIIRIYSPRPDPLASASSSAQPQQQQQPQPQPPLREAALPPVYFLLLLFNQLHGHPFIRDPVLKGDEFPRRIYHAHHPLGHLDTRRYHNPTHHNQHQHHGIHGHGLNSSVGAGTSTTTSSSGSVTPISYPANSRCSAFGTKPSDEWDTSTVASPPPPTSSIPDNKTPTISPSTDPPSPSTPTLTSSPSFPTQVVEGRHHLASFWRSSGKQWLHLVYIVYRGRQIDKDVVNGMVFDTGGVGVGGGVAGATKPSGQTQVSTASVSVPSVTDTPTSSTTTLHRHELAEALELDIKYLDIFDFLFTAVCTRHHAVRDKLRQLFVDWVMCEREGDLDVDLADLDTIVGSHGGGHVTDPVELFRPEPAMHVLTDFCTALISSPSSASASSTSSADTPNGHAIRSISLETINQWVMWALIERPVSITHLKLTESGVAYGVDHPDAIWFRDASDPPQTLISRQRNGIVIVHAGLVDDAAVFIHRCYDTHVYVLGHVRSVCLYRCRDVTVCVGAVAGQLTLVQCERVKVSAVCGQLVAASTTVALLQSGSGCVPVSTTGSDSIVAYVNTMAMPVVWCNSMVMESAIEEQDITSSTDVKTSVAGMDDGLVSVVDVGVSASGVVNDASGVGIPTDSLLHHAAASPNTATTSASVAIGPNAEVIAKGFVIAPCNMYYEGILDDIQAAGLRLDVNLWDQVVIAWDRYDGGPVNSNGVVNKSPVSVSPIVDMHGDPDVDMVSVDSDHVGVASRLGESTHAIAASSASTLTHETGGNDSKSALRNLVMLLPPSMFFMAPLPFDRIHPSDVKLSSSTTVLHQSNAHAGQLSTAVSLVSVASSSGQSDAMDIGDDDEDDDDENASNTGVDVGHTPNTIQTTTATAPSTTEIQKHAVPRRDSSTTMLDFDMDDMCDGDIEDVDNTVTVSTHVGSTTTTTMPTSTLTEATRSPPPTSTSIHMTHDDTIERVTMLSALPDTYRTCQQAIDTIIHDARDIIQKTVASVEDVAQFQVLVECEFQEWLRRCGYVGHLAGLIDADRDMDRIRRSSLVSADLSRVVDSKRVDSRFAYGVGVSPTPHADTRRDIGRGGDRDVMVDDTA